MSRIRSEGRLLALALAGGAVPLALAAVVIATELPRGIAWTLAGFAAFWWLGGALVLRGTVAYRLRTVSNLLSTLREGDYSFRLRGAGAGEAFGELAAELNALARKLRAERFGEIEATALLGKVMAEIDAAVLAFDGERRLRLINPAGARLAGGTADSLIGRKADEIGLGECLDGPGARTVALRLAGGPGHYEMRRGLFRQHGRPHHLVILSDVSRALRAEEVAAWRRIIRVLGHELNNSLTPIKSIAGSISGLLARKPPPPDWREDVQRGLEVIASRAEALNNLMGAYTRLARLPQPKPAPLPVAPWVRRVAGLETRLPVKVEEGAGAVIEADRDQLDLVLINLIRNAVDASLETGGGVRVGWKAHGGALELWIEDEGPGLASTENLFVPFFTTKPGGTGIGLALSRQIVEAHGGTVELANRVEAPGCRARIRLPLSVIRSEPAAPGRRGGDPTGDAGPGDSTDGTKS